MNRCEQQPCRERASRVPVGLSVSQRDQKRFASRFIVALIGVTIVFFIVFLVREFTADHPVVDLRVFKQRTYSAGVVLMTVVGFVLYGSLVLLPVWIQTLLGYPALQAGIALAPRGMGSMLGMPLIGAIMPRTDPRRFLAAGLCIGAATLWQFSTLSLDTGYWNLFWPQFIQGFARLCCSCRSPPLR